MLFYTDPYGDEKRFSKIDEIRDNAGGDRKITRLFFDQEEGQVVMFQETFCCGHNNEGSVSFSPAVAKKLFPVYADRIDSLSK